MPSGQKKTTEFRFYSCPLVHVKIFKYTQFEIFLELIDNKELSFYRPIVRYKKKASLIQLSLRKKLFKRRVL